MFSWGSLWSFQNAFCIVQNLSFLWTIPLPPPTKWRNQEVTKFHRHELWSRFPLEEMGWKLACWAGFQRWRDVSIPPGKAFEVKAIGGDRKESFPWKMKADSWRDQCLLRPRFELEVRTNFLHYMDQTLVKTNGAQVVFPKRSPLINTGWSRAACGKSTDKNH